jgi:ribosomal protein L11 methylase PrmA
LILWLGIRVRDMHFIESIEAENTKEFQRFIYADTQQSFDILNVLGVEFYRRRLRFIYSSVLGMIDSDSNKHMYILIQLFRIHFNYSESFLEYKDYELQNLLFLKKTFRVVLRYFKDDKLLNLLLHYINRNENGMRDKDSLSILEYVIRSKYGSGVVLKKIITSENVDRLLFRPISDSNYKSFYSLLKYGNTAGIIYAMEKQVFTSDTREFTEYFFTLLLNTHFNVIRQVSKYISEKFPDLLQDESFIFVQNERTFSYMIKQPIRFLIKKLRIIKPYIHIEIFMQIVHKCLKCYIDHRTYTLFLELPKVITNDELMVTKQEEILNLICNHSSYSVVRYYEPVLTKRFYSDLNSRWLPHIKLCNSNIYYFISKMIEHSGKKNVETYFARYNYCYYYHSHGSPNIFGYRIFQTFGLDFEVMYCCAKFRTFIERYCVEQNESVLNYQRVLEQLLITPSLPTMTGENSFMGQDYKRLLCSNYTDNPVTMGMVEIAEILHKEIYLTAKADGVHENILGLYAGKFSTYSISKIMAEKVMFPDGSEHYLIYNAVGNLFYGLDIYERLMKLQEILPPLPNISIKPMENVLVTEEVLRRLDQDCVTEYPNDGYIIYYLGKSFKLKSKHNLTIDVLYKDGQFYSSDDEVVEINTGLVGDSLALEENGIYSVVYSDESQTWYIRNQRFDKKRANPIQIIEKIQDIRQHYKLPSQIFESIVYYMNSAPSFSRIHKQFTNNNLIRTILGEYVQPGSTWLDIGCGYGYSWNNFEADIVGIDQDPFVVNKFNDNYLCNFRRQSYCFDMNEWKSQKQFLRKISGYKFDGILLNFTIQYANSNLFELFQHLMTTTTGLIVIIRFIDTDLVQDDHPYISRSGDQYIYNYPWKTKPFIENSCTMNSVLSQLNQYVSFDVLCSQTDEELFENIQYNPMNTVHRNLVISLH